MEPSFRHWKGSSGPKVRALGRLRSCAIRVVHQVCLYAKSHYNAAIFADTCSSNQKGVMISHRNVISNVLQIATFEKPYRDSRREPGSKYTYTEIALGLLPQSHIYALVVICHATTWRGDQVINLPKFEITQFLTAIQRYKINTLFLVSQLQLSPHDLMSDVLGASYHYCHGEEQASARQI